MNIHEHQGKALFARYGVPVLRGVVCRTPDEAAAAFTSFGSPVVAVKSQIHAGGRGKGTVYADRACTRQVIAGGVHLARSADQARSLAANLLGNYLRTHQTGSDARKVNALYVEDGCRIARELYVSILLDRAVGLPVVVASAEGGMDIEEVAARAPDRILRTHFDPLMGLQAWQCRSIAFGLGLAPTQIGAFTAALQGLARTFLECDCDLVEVNPLVITADDGVIALDAKVTLDDNALFRHPEYQDWIDVDEEDPSELEAKRHDMAFVKLGGNIGCLVNGAGLAMATVDAIAIYGEPWRAAPANFLDVGGGATAAKVATAFKIILKDPQVEAILVNIFGGIMRCDTIAEGVIAAVKEVGLDRPLVVRLEGTNVELGKQLLAESGLNVITANDLRDGCAKAAEAAVAYRNSSRKEA